MDDKKVYIEQTEEAVNKMTERLYQEQITDALSIMNEILDKLVHVSEMVLSIDSIEDADKTKMVELLGESMKAMESRDYVLLADVMHYDIIELLEKYKSCL